MFIFVAHEVDERQNMCVCPDFENMEFDYENYDENWEYTGPRKLIHSMYYKKLHVLVKTPSNDYSGLFIMLSF